MPNAGYQESVWIPKDFIIFDYIIWSFGAIGLGITVFKKDINNLVSKTLLAVQAKRFDLDIAQTTNQIITKLYEMEALTASDTAHQSKVLTNPCQIEPSTTLHITKMGKACIKANVDVHQFEIVYKDLGEAVLSDTLSNRQRQHE